MVSAIERAIIEQLFFLKESVKYTVSPNLRQPTKKMTLEEKLFSEKVKTKINAPLGPGAIRFDAGDIISSLMPKLQETPSGGFSIEHSRELSFAERKQSYSVTVEYFENEKQESITVTAEDEKKKKYTFAAIREKPVPEPLPYTLQVTYARD